MELSEYLQEGCAIGDMYDITQESTSQYESNYKLDQYFMDKFNSDEGNDEIYDDSENVFDVIDRLISGNKTVAMHDENYPLLSIGD